MFTATLLNNPTTRDFASILPPTLKIDDHSTNEKIAYLPRKLTGSGTSAMRRRRPRLFRALGAISSLTTTVGPT
ncbi:cyclophilin-like fold protein [Ancylobacter pratisalsi]|uniref:cyclophilin-like fold protein n=1 Tax=Ancylobacter pratisalsi TaxID=1745854 RepID=UPI001FE598E6|nr:cyclophilin-like fold protein [Ancylobacter pratisalsi]